MYIYFGEHVDGGPLTPPVHVNLALNASAFKNMSVDVGLSGRTHPEISWSKDDTPLNMPKSTPSLATNARTLRAVEGMRVTLRVTCVSFFLFLSVYVIYG